MKHERIANRLPGLDSRTSNAEATAFACMGIAALILIGAAAIGSMRYADQRENIVQSLTEPATAIVQTPSAPKATTNIAARIVDSRPDSSS